MLSSTWNGPELEAGHPQDQKGNLEAPWSQQQTGLFSKQDQVTLFLKLKGDRPPPSRQEGLKEGLTLLKRVSFCYFFSQHSCSTWVFMDGKMNNEIRREY